jgi:hypothetical protein
MSKNYLIATAAAVLLGAVQAASAGDASRVNRLLDSLDVEHHWPAYVRVDADSGDPMPRGSALGVGRHPHCATFVHAVARRVGVDMGLTQTANDVIHWLRGQPGGWRRLAGPVEAQALANRGEFVVGAREMPPWGHIAVVRASSRLAADVLANGPEITQVGNHNYTDTTASVGFGRANLGAVEYYAHAL